MASRSQKSAGFTLLEMSVVLLIIATLAGGGAVMLGAYVQKRQAQETDAKIKAIQEALLKFRFAFHRLPCPGDLALATSNLRFGIEGATSNPNAAATTCVGGTPAATRQSGWFAEGSVPTKTLGLPDDMAIDGWGRKIQYIVDKRATRNNAFLKTSGYYITLPDVTTRMSIKNTGTDVTAKSSLALYILLSSGPNGHGAYPRNSTSPISSGSTNLDELINCYCIAAGTHGVFSTTFIQKPATEDYADITNKFDDILVYGTRATLRSPTE